MKKKTTEQFIEESKNIHGDKYDYSLVNYINNKTKIKIICPIHGVFEQRADSHKKYGCKKCSYEQKKLKYNDFLIKSNKYHNNKYSYNKDTYLNINTKMEIICPIHGVFEQSPKNHLYRGCKKCKNNKIGNIKRKILIDFILECNLIHNNKYDYSLVNYINNKTKIKIICPEHGVFEQRPDDHTRGIGCPICNESTGEKEIRNLLNNNNIDFDKEKTFKNCKYKRQLPFDFYLPDYNTCIEFDGIQHFKSINFFGGKKEFKNQQKKDKIKNQFCKNNNINLIRIKYTDNIKEKLKPIFSL